MRVEGCWRWRFGMLVLLWKPVAGTVTKNKLVTWFIAGHTCEVGRQWEMSMVRAKRLSVKLEADD